jgi:hypothetical protein
MLAQIAKRGDAIPADAIEFSIEPRDVSRSRAVLVESQSIRPLLDLMFRSGAALLFAGIVRAGPTPVERHDAGDWVQIWILDENSTVRHLREQKVLPL